MCINRNSITSTPPKEIINYINKNKSVLFMIYYLSHAISLYIVPSEKPDLFDVYIFNSGAYSDNNNNEISECENNLKDIYSSIGLKFIDIKKNKQSTDDDIDNLKIHEMYFGVQHDGDSGEYASIDFNHM